MKTAFRYFSVIVLLNIFLFVTAFAARAQETNDSSTEISDPALVLSLSVLPQTYPDKKIPIQIDIDSQIDSGKAGIQWIYEDKLLRAEGPETDIVTVTSGNRTTLIKYFLPAPNTIIESNQDLTRVIEINVRVNAFQSDRNYLSAKNVKFLVNTQMEIEPPTDEYKQDKFIYTALQWLKWISIVTLIVITVAIAIKKFIDYINSEDEEV